MKLSLINLALFFIVVSACNRTQKESVTEKKQKPDIEENIPAKTKPTVKKVKPENFNSFYNRFHSDSLFQISRVKFPLANSEKADIEKNNWIMHRSTINNIDTSMFKTKITKTDNYYKEVIYIEGGGFYLERVFKRINGKWYLTSFVDENY